MKSCKTQEFASSAQRITVGKEFLITAYKTQDENESQLFLLVSRNKHAVMRFTA